MAYALWHAVGTWLRIVALGQACINSTLTLAFMKKPVKNGRGWKHIRKLKMKPSKKWRAIHAKTVQYLTKAVKVCHKHTVVMKRARNLLSKSHRISPGRKWKAFPRCAKPKKRVLGKGRTRCAAPSTPVRALNKSGKACAKVSTPIKALNKVRKTCAKPATPFKAMKKSHKICSKPSIPVKSMKTSTTRKVMTTSTVMIRTSSMPVKVMKASTPMKGMKACTPVKVMKAASMMGSSGLCRKLANKNKPEIDSCSDEEAQKSSVAARGGIAKGKSRLSMLGRTAMAGRSGSARGPPKSSSPAGALRMFLMNAIGVTSEPAAFQLRCTQKAGEGVTPRTVVFVVGGKCRLWKLNQVLAECFDVSEEEFSYEPLKGRPVLGSRLVVTRPQEPGKCSKALICSRRSAIVGGQIDCVDDRNHSVAELFRGASTRDALVRLPQDAAQRVCFISPSLETEVAVTLDGIMLDSYDSHTLFDQDKKKNKKRPVLDKLRRHCNGRRPLPRIVRSSFLSTAEIEAKNIFMQGSREGPDFLLKIATPWSALHTSCRRSQRKPLFRKDGRDFDLNDLCHVNGDVESDAEDSD